MDIKKRGIGFFIIDAIFGALLIFTVIFLASSFYPLREAKVNTGVLTNDFLTAFSEIKLYEVNNTFIVEQFNDGNITNLNRNVLEQIAIFWSEGKSNLASQLASSFDGIIPGGFGFGILAGNDMIYQRSKPEYSHLVSSKHFISGIEEGKPTDGFVAKAFAQQVTKNITYVINIEPSGSSYYGSSSDPGEALIKRYFTIGNSTGVTAATLSLSIHIGQTGPNWEVVNINGLCSIYRDDLDFTSGEGVFDKKTVTNCFVDGNNQIIFKIRNTGYQGHIHPGTRLEITQTVESGPAYFGETTNTRYYFDDITSSEGGGNSKSGAWAVLPFYIPENALNYTVSMNIATRNVDNTEGNRKFDSAWAGKLERKDYDYMIFLNNVSPFDFDASPSGSGIQDYSYTMENMGFLLKKGTNMVSIYTNNYGDERWGLGDTRIYSDPINDPGGSSYVDVSYTVNQSEIVYGSIEITNVQEFGGSQASDMEGNFSFPQESVAIGEVFVHIVERFSKMIEAHEDILRVYADQNSPANNLVYESPVTRATPSKINIPESYLDDSEIITNYVRVTEATSGDNIHPATAVEYSFFVVSFVPFGRVFANISDAETDAFVRLNQTIGSFAEGLNIQLNSNRIKNVPSMIGPVLMEVRIWA